MRFAREITALLLVVALMLATGARAEVGHGFLFPIRGLAATDDRSTDDHPVSDDPAGCHALSGKNSTDSRVPDSPLRAPVHHRCCLTGHDVATIQSSYFSQPLTRERAIVQIDRSLAVRDLENRNVSTILFADPPGMTSLRI